MNPNLNPVLCYNLYDIQVLAQEMRDLCLSEPPDTEEYRASKTIEEAEATAKSAQQSIIDSGHLRFIYYVPDDLMVNVVFTLLETPDRSEWDLSLSVSARNRLFLKEPERVEDNLAKLICDAFLDDSYEEVEPKAIFKYVRHFVKIISKTSK